MVRRLKSPVAPSLILAIATLAGGLNSSCNHHQQRVDDEVHVEQAGEPEQYSATVVRTVHAGTTSEISVTREARSGEKRRQEWTEQDQNRALIWRPDLGKSFLLDLDRRVYVEMEITAHHVPESEAGASATDVSSSRNAHGPYVGNSAVHVVDQSLDDEQSPAGVETRILSPVVIDGHSCRVYEQRTTFIDGHTEITRRFRADDLGGLALRIESESEGGAVKVTTERRDVGIEVAPDAFAVPADFKRIGSLR